MIKEKMLKAVNKQINAEMYSSYLYLSMSAYFESINLRGLAKWMKVQSGEEWGHAMRLYDHIIDRGGKVSLAGIDEPPSSWKSALVMFEEAYKHEQKITGMIHELVDLAIKENDHAANNMLQWFVAEQVEEEANTSEISNKLEMIGDSVGGLLMLDHQLGKRGEK